MQRIMTTPLLTAALFAAPFSLLCSQEVTKPRTTTTVARLPAPAKITAVQEPDGRIRVVWNAVEGAAKYVLARSVPNLTNGVVALPNPKDTQYVDSDVKKGYYYYYVVNAAPESGTGGLKKSAPPVVATISAGTSTATTTDTAPTPVTVAAPTNVVAKPYPYMEPTVTWQSSEARARFLVERRVPQTDPNAGWKQVIEYNRLPGFWKCCVAHDDSPPENQDLVYRVTAVDTVAPNVKSPPALSNTIVNLKIYTDPPVLSDLTIRVGESKRLPWPLNRPSDLENIQWVSLSPGIVSVDLALGIVTALARGQGYQGYIVASGIASRHVPYVGTWIWRVNVEP